MMELLVHEATESYKLTEKNTSWVEVLVDCVGTEELYVYSVPSELSVNPGDILSVPFGAQFLGAIAIRLITTPPDDLDIHKIKPVYDVIATGFFPADYYSLLEKIADYYYTPMIQVVKAALPPGLLAKSNRRISLTTRDINKEKLTPTARDIIEILEKQKDGDYSWKYLNRQVRYANKGLRELVKKGLVKSYLETSNPVKAKYQKAVVLVKSDWDEGEDLKSRHVNLLQGLKRLGGEVWLNDFIKIEKTTVATLKTLQRKGYIVIEDREVLRRYESGLVVGPDQAKTLTIAQSAALERINSLTGFAEVLLHGVTGSGKTEVYLQAIAPILEQGKSALVLVPEIGLTPQLTDRFRARFGDRVNVYHSGLSEGERYDTWRSMLSGHLFPKVIIGTRSAVLAPLSNIGLIILDEEHDDSFKQTQPVPTYHARTVALWKAEQLNCPLILGSATPSLDSWIRIKTWESGYYVSLPERIQSRPLPPVEVVDLRRELKEGNRSIFSRSLIEAISEIEEKGQQGILFIHRRGHSTFVSCRSCGYVIECPNCDVSLAYHQTYAGGAQLLRCHYCNYVTEHPDSCPECSSPYLKFFGSGTQKVSQELAKLFPKLRVIRFDGDTTNTKGAHRNLLNQFATKQADLLVGTQMLTKGIDLPQVTLVGIVAADGLLYFPDFRSAERAFQTLTQVAGRSGRGEDPGRVILQTYTPHHPVIQAVARHEYEEFVERELSDRKALNYPPYGRLILLRLSSLDAKEVEDSADLLVTVLEETLKEENVDIEGSYLGGYEILGPAPASILRVANRYRWQIMIKFNQETLPKLPYLSDLRNLCGSGVSLAIDVDPIYLM